MRIIIDDPHTADLSAPRRRADASEALIAKTFQVMVAFGCPNNRMKDCHDMLLISQPSPFEDDWLGQWPRPSNSVMLTILTDLLDALAPDFAGDKCRQCPWSGVLESMAFRSVSLADVIARVYRFIMTQAITAAAVGRSD
ncbi:hypothetical protein [Marichromatium gracile]|uniref:hypothetical protein n=1 Tax=Marichromatium gracile TaxID=1048 RepID=UPI00128FE72D|nr:hypothetical protein [Marichromatium gracile]